MHFKSFADQVQDGLVSARAILKKSEAEVQVGDVVEIKFAHKNNPGYFPVKEVTRVTELIAKKGEVLAREFERRILARDGPRPTPPGWLLQAQSQRSNVSPAPEAATATAMR